MPYAPKPRRSYSKDISYISQLTERVERDVLRDEKWRVETIAKLKDLTENLLRAPNQDI